MFFRFIVFDSYFDAPKSIYISISYGYTMRKVKIAKETSLRVTGIEGFFKRIVTKFGNSAKVDCPKEYLGRDVYLAVIEGKRGKK